jgi:surface antigen
MRRTLPMALALALSLIVSTGPAEAAQTVMCRSYKWKCDGGQGYNPNRSYWSQLPGHNCTNYVAFRMIKDGASTKFGPFHGNAKEWDNYFRSAGYKVNGTPRVGAIAQWNAGEGGRYHRSGHVAYVSKVTDTYIIVDEDAWRGNSMRRKIFKGDAGWPGRFIHMVKA